MDTCTEGYEILATDHNLSNERRHRAHRRSKVSAQIQVTEAGSGRLIHVRLGNVSAGGCLLESETDSSLSSGTALTIAITRGSQLFQSEAKVVHVAPEGGIGVMFTDTEPKHLRVLTAWIMESAWLAADRRKNQRIALNVPVILMGNDAIGRSFTEEVQTLKVSADGCSLQLATPLNKGQYVTLLHGRTKAMAECMIVRTEQSSVTRLDVGMTFLLPNRKFWQVNFPPVG
jgi:PilZ domain